MIGDAVRTLYRTLSWRVVQSRRCSLLPPAHRPTEDPVIGVQRLAAAIVRYLQLDGVRLIVSFDGTASYGPASEAGHVELGRGPDYFVRLNDRLRYSPFECAAALAHEAMHVYLHRRGIRFDDRYRNELLTDTAAAYLGVGWLLLNAYRVDTRSDLTEIRRLGYLTPEEFGYVLAKRSFAYGDDIEPQLRGNPAAWYAYRAGWRRAASDYHHPPLAQSGRGDALRYGRDRKRAKAGRTVRATSHGYRFAGDDRLVVVFRCPACTQQIRVPVDRKATVRCGLCRSMMTCRT